MLRQRLTNNFSRSQNKISPSPKPFNFPNQDNQRREQSMQKYESSQHRRMKTCVEESFHSNIHKKRSILHGTKHSRAGSALMENNETCMNKSFNMINSKIQNILSNYKEYDTKTELTVKEPQRSKEIKYFHKKTAKRQKGLNKENQIWNQKVISKGKAQILKQHSSEKNILRDITVENVEQNLIKDQTTISTKIYSGVVSFEESQENSQVFRGHNSQTMLSVSETSHQEVIRRPKIFQKLKNMSSQKSMAISLVEQQEQIESEMSQKDKLINLFFNQIMLDQRFIKAKQWFKEYKKQHKWWLLERELKKNRFWINELTMKATFITKLQEESPDYVIKQEQFSIKTLVIAFKEAQEHWLTKIRNSFDYETLKEEGFIDNQLGANQKGFISIEDLIRFLNFELKTFYSTRQLQLIYLRLKQSEHLQFYDLVENITRSNI